MATPETDYLTSAMEYTLTAVEAKDAIERLLVTAASAVGSEMGSFYLLNEDEQVLRPFVTFNFPQAYAEACAEVRVGAQCCGRAVEHKTPWIVEDMLTDPLFAEAREGAANSDVRSAFSVPVLDARGNCLGSLAVHFKRPFTPNAYQLERQSLFAKLIAFALVKYGVVNSEGARQRAA